MIYKNEEAEKRAALTVADLMMAAARTAPKGKGMDNVVAIALDGKEKKELSSHMGDMGKETGSDRFIRDAANVDSSHLVLLLAVRKKPLQLSPCGLCGFENCKVSVAAGANCVFNITDLGIAVGSAVSVAADNRIDNRVMYTIGLAALRMDCLPEDVAICFGIPLSTGAKSVFFDR